MSSGSPTDWGPGVPASLNSLTLHPEDPLNVRCSHNPSGGHADIAAHPGLTTTGRSGEQQPGIPNVDQFTPPFSHQGTIPDHVLDNIEQFDDAPYVPPRASQAELQTYSALDPALGDVYDPPSHDVRHQYPYEGGTSPAESHHSIESSWSNSSSSSASSQRLSEFFVEPTFSQAPPPPRNTSYYPAFQGQHRLGLEHVRYGEQPSNTGGTYYRTTPYSIDNLLSPEIFDDVTVQVPEPSQMNYPAMSSQAASSSSSSVSPTNPSNVTAFSSLPTSATDCTRSLFPDAGAQLRQQLGLSAHGPVSLHSLPDPPPGEKPSTPLPMLVKLAIYGSRNKQLTLQEIYTELENRFQWFRDHKNDKAWKNSIRHNLSLNKVFQHVPRPITEPGKGSYWQLDMSGGEGYKRVRKRRPKNRMVVSEEEDGEASELDDPSQRARPGRSSATPVEDGHVVGEGRARSTTRRAAGGSPYPTQSPRYQQAPLPVVQGQDSAPPEQPLPRFVNPSFGQSSFPTFPQTRPIPVASSAFAALSSPSTVAPPSTTMIALPQSQQAASYDPTTPISQLPPQLGVEYVVGPEGPPTARRDVTYPESGEQGDAVQSSPTTSSSSGSSRTWNHTPDPGA